MLLMLPIISILLRFAITRRHFLRHYCLFHYRLIRRFFFSMAPDASFLRFSIFRAAFWLFSITLFFRFIFIIFARLLRWYFSLRHYYLFFISFIRHFHLYFICRHYHGATPLSINFIVLSLILPLFSYAERHFAFHYIIFAIFEAYFAFTLLYAPFSLRHFFIFRHLAAMITAFMLSLIDYFFDYFRQMPFSSIFRHFLISSSLLTFSPFWCFDDTPLPPWYFIAAVFRLMFSDISFSSLWFLRHAADISFHFDAFAFDAAFTSFTRLRCAAILLIIDAMRLLLFHYAADAAYALLAPLIIFSFIIFAADAADFRAAAADVCHCHFSRFDAAASLAIDAMLSPCWCWVRAIISMPSIRHYAIFAISSLHAIFDVFLFIIWCFHAIFAMFRRCHFIIISIIFLSCHYFRRAYADADVFRFHYFLWWCYLMLLMLHYFADRRHDDALCEHYHYHFWYCCHFFFIRFMLPFSRWCFITLPLFDWCRHFMFAAMLVLIIDAAWYAFTRFFRAPPVYWYADAAVMFRYFITLYAFRRFIFISALPWRYRDADADFDVFCLLPPFRLFHYLLLPFLCCWCRHYAWASAIAAISSLPLLLIDYAIMLLRRAIDD